MDNPVEACKRATAGKMSKMLVKSIVTLEQCPDVAVQIEAQDYRLRTLEEQKKENTTITEDHE